MDEMSLAPYVEKWESAYARGQDLAPEQVCADRPELIGPLRSVIGLLRGLRGGTEGHGAAEATPTQRPASAPQRPDRIAGHEILGELGRGGMGVVYKARHVALNRQVALKMILAAGHADADARRRFLVEAEAIAKIRHPGIVQIFDYGTHEGLPFFSLELCPASLAGKLEDGPLPPREAAAVVEKIARAVQAAHDAGIVHRDLKPANVLLAEDGSPRVTDFGLARNLDAGSSLPTGAIVGTPSYMSPEQARGSKAVGPLTDVYALGAILYACLTGRPPFRAASVMDTLGQVIASEPVPVRQLNAAVPVDLETIVLKCLNKEDWRRYPSAAALADDLRRFLEGRPVEARPVGPFGRLVRWCLREPLVASLTAAVALALVAGTAASLAFAFQADANAREAADNAEDAREQERLAKESEKKALTQQRLAGESEKKALEREKEANDQRDRAELLGYSSLLNLANRVWHDNQPARAVGLLHRCEPRLRGWEHRYLWTAIHASRRVLPRPPGRLVSPDGKRFIKADTPGQDLLRDAATGKVIQTLRGLPSTTTWAWAPDGKHFAGTNGTFLRIWDLEAGREIHSARVETTSLAWSPDSKRLAWGMRGEHARVQIWELATRKTLHDMKSTEKSPSPPTRLIWAPTGKHLASLGAESAIRVWDAGAGKELAPLVGHQGQVRDAAWGAEGATLASAGLDGTVRTWFALRGEKWHVILGHLGGVVAVTWAQGGSRLHVVSASGDGTIRVWDLNRLSERTGIPAEVMRISGVDQNVESLRMSPDGERVVATGHRSVEFDLARGVGPVPVPGQRDTIYSVSWSPDGKRLAGCSSDHTAPVWGAGRRERVLALAGHTKAVSAVAWSPDGRRIATASDDLTVRIWDAKTGKQEKKLEGHARRCESISWAPDGKRLACAGDDGTVRAWDVEAGRQIWKLSLGGPTFATGVAWSPAGDLIALYWGGGNRELLSASTGARAHVFPGGRANCSAAAWSGDGKRLLLGGLPNAAEVWDVPRRKLLFRLGGHENGVVGAGWTKDGRRIITGASDGKLHVWDAASGASIIEFANPVQRMIRLAVGPDDTVATVTGESAPHPGVQLWDASWKAPDQPPPEKPNLQ